MSWNSAEKVMFWYTNKMGCLDTLPKNGCRDSLLKMGGLDSLQSTCHDNQPTKGCLILFQKRYTYTVTKKDEKKEISWYSYKKGIKGILCKKKRYFN